MRKLPSTTVSPMAVREFENRVVEERSYTLVTPLFGGGAEARIPDPVTVIRGSSIRGQLRFWWRACQWGRFATIGEMRREEELLWGGSTSHASQKNGVVSMDGEDEITPSPMPVQISILRATARSELAKRNFSDTDTLFYAAFALRPSSKADIMPAYTGAKFVLKIDFPASRRAEVEGALWAWEIFGGLGGRTRRGFGSLKRSDPGADYPPDSVRHATIWLNERLTRHVAAGDGPPGVPHLARNIELRLAEKCQSEEGAWAFAVRKLRNFRQQRVGSKFGASLWPEAKAIRQIADSGWDGDHIHSNTSPAFPRAAFGLPIIFHFLKVKKRKEPEDSTLSGEGSERLASPILLHCLPCRPTGALPMVIRLQTAGGRQRSLKLSENENERGQRDGTHQVEGLRSQLTQQELYGLQSDGLACSSADVLTAFLDYFVQKSQQ